MKYKAHIGVFFITIVLLLIIEGISHQLARNIPFLWDFSSFTLKENDPRSGFDQIDPLLGYAKTTNALNEQGFKVEKGCIVISDSLESSREINILITGGSTSDISLYASNWPVEFHKILISHGIHAKIYCAAAGGYNSGQELLKLIRDGLETKPLIHISYSGANDSFKQSWVSGFEQTFYESKVESSNSAILMPGTVFLLHKLLNRFSHSQISLRPKDQIPGAQFWEKNMRLMHSLSVEYHYTFIGLLQPVMGGGLYDQKMTAHKKEISEYKERYPLMKEAAVKYPEYITDLSSIFDTCKEHVFIDHCHIHKEFQHMVAENIYEVLNQKNLLK